MLYFEFYLVQIKLWIWSGYSQDDKDEIALITRARLDNKSIPVTKPQGSKQNIHSEKEN